MTGMKCPPLHRLQNVPVDGRGNAHVAQVDDLRGYILFLPDHGHFLGRDQSAVLAGKPHGLAAVAIDQAHDLFVDLARQNHFHHVHGLAVGDAHARDKGGFDLQTLEKGPDLGPAAVDHHRVQPDVLEQDHVLGEPRFQVFVHHGVAAVLDDNGPVRELADIRQGLDEEPGLVLSVGLFAHRAKPRVPRPGAGVEL